MRELFCQWRCQGRQFTRQTPRRWWQCHWQLNPQARTPVLRQVGPPGFGEWRWT